MLLNLGGDFRVEVTLRLQERDQVLASFLDQFRINPNLRVYREQLMALPAPEMCTHHLDMHHRPRLHLESDVGTVRLRVVVRPNQMNSGC